MIALLDGPFIRMALVGGLLFCLVASILSPWVVLRRLSYATDALAHATFGGIALALFFGMQGVVDNAGSGKVLLISLAFSLLVSQLLALLMRQSFLSQDAATGIVYAGAFAFGGIFLAIRRDDIPNHHGLESLLFGNIFLLEPLELWILGVISLLALACAWFWRRDMMLWAFDSDIAMAEGVRTGLLHFSLMGTVAVVTVVATRFMGLMMVMAFLVIPGSVGLMFGRSFAGVYWVSWAFASFSMVSGLIVIENWLPSVPPGSLTTAIAFVLFLLAVLIRSLCSNQVIKKSRSR